MTIKKLTVISGKGGTGKTTVISNLAALADNVVLGDCDVDAPNMHLLLKPTVEKKTVFKSAKLAVKDEDSCNNCGLCREFCRFKAINEDLSINLLKCDGCGVCAAVCPSDAIHLEEQITGHIYHSNSRFGPMIHAKLKAGADNSGKLVSEVKKEADKTAVEQNKKLILIDGSPGIGCPVIASLNGVDMALVVTEPTQSGLADLVRVLGLSKHFNIQVFVVINKYDLNEKMAAEINKYCREKGISVIGKIPFSREINEAMHLGELIVNYKPAAKPAVAIRDMWQKVKEISQL